RHYQAQRKAMLGGERLAIDLVGEQHVAFGEPRQRYILRVMAGAFAIIGAVIEPVGVEEACFRRDARLFEQRLEIDAAPDDVADAPGGDVRAPWKARALMETLDPTARQAAELGKAEALRAGNQAADLELPRRGIDPGDAEMREHKEVALRRDARRPLMRRERHAADEAGGVERHGRQSGRSRSHTPSLTRFHRREHAAMTASTKSGTCMP